MRIIVFIKTVKYIYAQTGTDPKKNFIGPDDMVHIINPLDEFAIEEALRIKERHTDSEIIVVSLGDRFAEEGLRRALSMGADRAIHFYFEDYENLDAWVTAMILASLIRNLQFDLIFCGREAVDDHGGLVGPYIAEILKVPHVSRVIKLEMDRTEKKVFLHRAVERGNRETMECTIPALFTVEKGINLPRYPTLPGILRSQQQIIEKLEIKDLELPMKPFDSAFNLTQIVSLSTPKPKTKENILGGGKLSASDRIRLVMKGGDSKKKEDSTILDGGSDTYLDALDRLFEKNGIIFR